MDKCERCKREVTEAVANFSKKKYDKTYCYDCQQVVNANHPTPATPQREGNPYAITLNGKQYVTHAGLLNAAHEIGLTSISTRMIDRENDPVIFEATVVIQDKETKEKRIFSAFGDASKESLTSSMVPHMIRMAETRAINRALRFATNIGMCSIEELGDK